MHAVVPPHVMYSPIWWKLSMFVDTQLYVLSAHGLAVRHPVACTELSVLKACRVPVGVHVDDVHVPPEQVGVPPLHALPHAPQFELFERTSTHAPLQYSWPSAQQFPPLHHSCAVHAVVQAPQ
jgi:hypothetical protein